MISLMKQAWRSLVYMVITMNHKVCVFRAGVFWVRAPLWPLITHDFSKFSRAEFRGLCLRHFGGKDDPDISLARSRHIMANQHHWEHWFTPVLQADGSISVEARDIPDPILREMVADWYGAIRYSQGYWIDPLDCPWWDTSGKHIAKAMTEDTQRRLISILEEAAARRCESGPAKAVRLGVQRPASVNK